MKDKLREEIAGCMPRDQKRLYRRLRSVDKAAPEAMAALSEEIRQAHARKQWRITEAPPVEYSMDLPIHARLEDIRQALSAHQVLVVCGETGSGKTTQLPKLCLAMGRGIDGQIGHTQPRRIAARAVATRIAEELKTPVGSAVGYKIRHTDHTSEQTYIKLMTDGILLAELQRDRQLNRYDTLIIDEAHERSLNVDFILGYLRQLLSRRPDLKLIITSATIDVARFSDHFDQAPVIDVAGRTYPVEVRYRPLEESGLDERDDEVDQLAILHAIRELSQEGQGDILVFLEGEREIHETTRFLNRQKLKNTDILPLYARLSSARQSHIFRPHQRRHIILATNVAETSLTIPGIRYVIDPGYARISRYNRRSRVQQLPVEKITQASAEQRKGRCGRVAKGICVRLYSEEDYQARAAFTDPEILRTNLASVILQMKLLNLGEIQEFPFIDSPDPRYINDGLRLLAELRALDDEERLTRTGRQLARLPLDPRLGAILLVADDLGCVSEALIIVSALSAQDPRERPLDAQEQADTAHERFRDERSDFLIFLNIWKFYHEHAKTLSQNKLHKLCRQNFLSYVRIREWKEVHKQLVQLLLEMDIHGNTEAADYNTIHCALLPGLLSHIAVKTEEKEYLGARGIKLNIFPGSSQFTKLPKWIVAAELVETSRLYARTVASINPQWLIRPAAHLLQHEYYEPVWDSRAQQVMAFERISLFGLTLVAGQKINYGKINPVEARCIFIRAALVEGTLDYQARFLTENRNIIEAIKRLEEKSRRHDIYNEEACYDFYARRVPAGITNGPDFIKWYASAAADEPDLLCVPRDEIMYHAGDAISPEKFPDALEINQHHLPLDYCFAPGEATDGVTIDVPLHLLNQITSDQLDRLVPGMLQEKVTCMLRALPKSVRRQLVPLPDTARLCVEHLPAGGNGLVANLAEYLFRTRGLKVSMEDWRSVELPEYLLINIRVVDENGHTIAQGRDLEYLQNQLATAAQAHLRTITTGRIDRDVLRSWDFDDLPEMVTIDINRSPVPVYPALVDTGAAVAIRCFDTREKANISMQSGLKKLFMLELESDFKYLRKQFPRFAAMSLSYAPIGSAEELKDDLVELVARQVFLEGQPDVRNRNDFAARKQRGAGMLVTEANRLGALVHGILESHTGLTRGIADLNPGVHRNSINDIRDHLQSLVFRGFLRQIPPALLEYYPRYLQALAKRIDKLGYAPRKDEIQLNRIERYWNFYKDLAAANKHTGIPYPAIDEFRFMLEEFRVSLFAQELGTVISVSPERLQRQLERIRAGSHGTDRTPVLKTR